ncbi:hypothetical protein [Kibdelosporangium aridum]|uniref:hypothetical protein n=1 Tax=Kibdelosporangium aridum TaxID=2030 RepID=UPI0035EDD008
MTAVRYVFALVLVLLPLGIGAVIYTPDDLRLVEFSREADPQEAAIRVNAPREAEVSVLLRSTVRGVEVTADYVIDVFRWDPLIDAVRTGVVDGKAVACSIAGAPETGVFSPPTVEFGRDDLRAKVLVSGTLTLSDTDGYIERPSSYHSGQVWERTLRVRTEGVSVVELHSDEGPALMGPDRIEFTGPINRYIYVSVESGSTQWTGWSLSQGPALWHIAMGVPWLLVLFLGYRSRHRVRGPLRAGAIAYVFSIPPLGAMLLWIPSTAGVILSGIFMVAPVLTLIWCRAVRGVEPLGRQVQWLACGALVLAVGTAAALLPAGSALTLIGGGAAAGASLAAAAWIAGRRSWAAIAALIGVTLVCGAPLVDFLVEQSALPYGGFALLTLGLLAAPVAIGLAAAIGARRKALGYTIAVVVSAVLFLPAAALVVDAVDTVVRDYPRRVTLAFATDAAAILVAALVTLLIMLIIRLSTDAHAYADPIIRMAMFVIVVIAVIPNSVSTLGQVLALLSLTFTLIWLVPANRADRAARLAAVGRRTHVRLVRLEIWQRLVDQVARETHRTGIARAAAGEVPLSTLYGTWSASVQPARAGINLHEAALGSGGGFSPRANLLAGVGAAAALALPIMAYEASLIFFSPGTDLSGQSTLELLGDGRSVLRWVVYGALFGLFYPALRGDRPIAKASALLVALLVPELLAIVLTPAASAEQIAFAVAIRAGQITVLCIGLGLFWEWRLSRSAGLRWGQLRDFRKAGALVTPVTTLVVAAATTVVTALAGAAVAAILQAPAGISGVGEPIGASTPR